MPDNKTLIDDLNDAVIKNPARQNPKPQVKYEPEYRRLGIEPRALIDKDREIIFGSKKPPNPITPTQQTYSFDPMQETYSSVDHIVVGGEKEYSSQFID